MCCLRNGGRGTGLPQICTVCISLRDVLVPTSPCLEKDFPQGMGMFKLEKVCFFTVAIPSKYYIC